MAEGKAPFAQRLRARLLAVDYFSLIGLAAIMGFMIWFVRVYANAIT